MIRIIKMKIAIEKNSWYNWLNNYILYFRAQDKKKKKKKKKNKKWLVVLNTKSWVFLKQRQPRIIENQYVSTMCMEVQRNKRNQQNNKKTKQLQQ